MAELRNRPSGGREQYKAEPEYVTVPQVVGVDAAAEAAAATEIGAHELEADPHPGYLTAVEGDAAYATLGHSHTVYNQTVEDEATPVTQRSTINFVGMGVSVSDVGSKTTVSIPGGAGEAFPVDYVFISFSPTNPATTLGYGTWTSIGAGRVLVGLDAGDTDFDTVGETGGAKTVASAGSNSAPAFTGSALATHQHAAITAGTPSGTNAAEAAHTHTYNTVIAHTHTLATGTGASGNFSQVIGTVDTTSGGTGAAPTQTALGTLSGSTGSASGTTSAGASHNHAFTGDAMATHQHAAISAGTPAGTVAAPTFTGSATSVVQPYLVVYMFRRTA